MKVKRYLAAALCAAMLLAILPAGPAGVFMEEAPAPTADPAQSGTQEQTEAPVPTAEAVPSNTPEQTEAPAPGETADIPAGQTPVPPAGPTETPAAPQAAEPSAAPDAAPPAGTETGPAAETAAPAGSAVETALELAVDRERSGRITQDAPVVYYHIKVSRTGSYLFASGGDIAVKATLMDADARTVAALKPEAGNDGGTCYILASVRLLKNVSYYLAVESDRPGKTGAFTLAFSREADEPAAETAPPAETLAPAQDEAADDPAAIQTGEPAAETAPPAETPAPAQDEAADVPAAIQTGGPAAETAPPAETPPPAQDEVDAPAGEPAAETAQAEKPAVTEKPAYAPPPPLQGVGRTAGYAGTPEDLRRGASPKGVTLYPESAHPYGFNEDSYQAYWEPDAIGYFCTFSASTELEANYDYVSICDQDKNTLTVLTGGAEKTRFTGSELSGFQVYILYPKFHVHLQSDGSVNKYGYKFTSIIPLYPSSSGTTTIRACEQYGTNSAYIIWNIATDAAGYADGYRLYRSTSQYGAYTCLKTVNTTYTYNYSLTQGQTYWYKVLPFDSDNVYSYSYSAAAPVTIMETPVITQAAVTGSNSAYIAWTASPGADGYRLYRSTSPNGTYTSLKKVTGNYTYNSGLAANTTYYYKVKAVRTYSTEVSGSLSAASPMVRCDVPVISAAQQNGTHSAYIAWSAVPGGDGYTLYRAASSAGPYTAIKSVTETSTTNTSLEPGMIYYYKVRPFTYSHLGDRIYGFYSSPASVCMLSAPVISSASASGDTTAYIVWGAVPAAVGYDLFRSGTPLGTYSYVKSVTTLNAYDYGLAAGTYYYKVAAYVLNGTTKVKSDKSASAAVVIGGDTTYRALVIGNWQFPSASDNRPWDDCARNIKAMLSYCNMNGTGYSTTVKYNQSASGVLSSIPAALSNADEDDVSLFYIGTHGVTGTGSSSGALYCSDGTYVYPTALRDALNQIKGTVIVFIDACGSGAYIKSASSAGAFNSAFISAFSGIEIKTGELKTSKFKVLTACAYNTSMWLMWDSYGYYYQSAYGYSYFSKYLCLAGGCDNESYTTLRGDTNKDSTVTLQEAYIYTRDNCNAANNASADIPAGDMVVQVYPASSSYPLFKR